MRRFLADDRRIRFKVFFCDNVYKALFMLPDVAPIHYGLRIVRSSADIMKTQSLNLVNLTMLISRTCGSDHPDP